MARHAILPCACWLLLVSCSAPQTPSEGGPALESLHAEWGLRLQETERLTRQRAGLLPELLASFDGDDPAAWRQSAAALDVLERGEAGFVYARILELLDDACTVGARGAPARAELVEMGRIIREADRFHSEDPAEWTAARQSLQKLGTRGVDAAVVKLILKLRTHDPENLEKIQREIAALGDGAVRHLVVALESESVNRAIKERCLDALVRIGAAAAPALVPLLDDRDNRSSRYYAARALGRIPAAPTAPDLARAEARETDPLVRCAMIESLSFLGGAEAQDAAVRALAADDFSVVKFGARALARLKAPRGLEALVDALERTQDEALADVREEVLAALRTLTGEPGGKDPGWWRERLGK